MRKTTVIISCDNCGEHIVEHYEETIVIVIDGIEFTSEWCDRCKNALVNKLTNSEDDRTCQTCGKELKSPAGLAIHKTRTGHS